MVTTSPSVRASREASFGFSASALPQTCFVSGLGHSCSQALLANVPSHKLGSGLNTMVMAAEIGRGNGNGRECGPLRRRARGYAFADDTFMESTGPPMLEVGSRFRPPRFPHQIIRRCIVMPSQQREDLVGAPSTVKRQDKRLYNARCAVNGPQIRPSLEVVVEWDMPRRKRRLSRRDSIPHGGERWHWQRAWQTRDRRARHSRGSRRSP